jgi:ribosomal protein S18 acetylase RimI-like enzyme
MKYFHTNIGRFEYHLLFVNGIKVIFGFNIETEFQRLGYGNFLLSEYLKTKQHIDVYLHVYSDNSKAINLYRKNGFHENYEKLICDEAYTPKLPISGYLIQMKKTKK